MLGAIAALGSLAIQAIVPALPMLAADIGTDAQGAQLVISVYLAGIAIGQFLWATLCDGWGRRPVIFAGISLFILGALLSGSASTLEVMLAGRIAQALGASGTLVASRAMATDSAPAGRAAGSLAVMSSIMLISPALSPIVGALIAEFWGWRSIFYVQIAVAAISMLLAIRLLPETRPISAEKGGTTPMRSYLLVLSDRQFMSAAIGNGLITAGFFTFLSVSPFLLMGRAGVTQLEAGVIYGIIAVGLIAGTLCVPLLERLMPARLGLAGQIVLLAGAIVLVPTALGGAKLLPFISAMTILALGTGLIAPHLMAQALTRHPARRGVAASLFGSLQMGVAALFSTIVVALLPTPELDLIAISILIMAALVVHRLWR